MIARLWESPVLRETVSTVPPPLKPAACMAQVPLWEWNKTRDSQGSRSAGVSRTRHGAMEALSRALIAAGQPASGCIVRVSLIRTMQEGPCYLRGVPERTAVYDGLVIQWS
jgi:hypothetical protein